MYKMIVMDLDGTLLRSNSTVSENSKRAIQKCKDQGIKVVLASGRMHYAMKPIIKELGLEEGLHIGGNGSIIFSLQGFIEVLPVVKEEKYPDLIDKLQKEQVEMLAYSKENIYYDFAPKLTQTIRRFYNNRIFPIQTKSIKDLKNIIKIVLYIKEQEKRKEEKIKKLLQEEVAIYRSHSLFVDIIHKNISKYRALQHVMKKYKINPKEVMAIGDSENDVEMIKNVGWGIAMCNGSDIVKHKADYITSKSNDQDGIVDILEQFVLKKAS
ncbi:Cof-type HAD-IIB family hydrolase [Garciella nitratireducens]|uniref:Haloacid dehalogenase-like hydrolase n=1 Tax=Garciella nitratireducens DSM 15102 TaxID=1121911 RepID=A0A1T4LTF1_9FIRM|nr:Cof-type HAD-IIB family hydrolase [Garciella nitratireducens]RBP38706.1 hypothetical protein DFR81_11824 [Garciella nitratireducens]SJZ57955.1 hypothetical protein SAMN02745973_01076 [Garciella nitratireducens DSM 15102]